MARRQSTNFVKQEANDHLLEIRRRKGVDGSNAEHHENVKDLDRALDM